MQIYITWLMNYFCPKHSANNNIDYRITQMVCIEIHVLNSNSDVPITADKWSQFSGRQENQQQISCSKTFNSIHSSLQKFRMVAVEVSKHKTPVTSSTHCFREAKINRAWASHCSVLMNEFYQWAAGLMSAKWKQAFKPSYRVKREAQLSGSGREY